ncbi:glycosyltransferase family 2 protein [Edwardsiella tarda]|uniref:glycosyltransferase family 2 protein n=1 Tax=Edwardsiella tarda TaxID=636 RepID=UPI00351C14A7
MILRKVASVLYSHYDGLIKSLYDTMLNFSFLKTDRRIANLDRLSYDAATIDKVRKQVKLKEKLPSISVVYRVKNGGEYLELSILSISAFATEVIVVDNDSSDNTIEIVSRLNEQLRGVCDVKLFNYKEKLAIAGKGYRQSLIKDPGGSLAKFYNYCFSLSSCDYVMKFDAHCMLLPSAIDKLQKEIMKSIDGVIFRGVEVYGKSLSMELYLYKKCLGFKYCDGDYYEMLQWDRGINVKRIRYPLFIHMKRLVYAKHLFCDGNVIAEKYK